MTIPATQWRIFTLVATLEDFLDTLTQFRADSFRLAPIPWGISCATHLDDRDVVMWGTRTTRSSPNTTPAAKALSREYCMTRSPLCRRSFRAGNYTELGGGKIFSSTCPQVQHRALEAAASRIDFPEKFDFYAYENGSSRKGHAMLLKKKL